MTGPFVEFRVAPTAEAARLPRPRQNDPHGAIIWTADLDAEGALVAGVLVETVEGTTTAEHLVYPGDQPSAELVAYVKVHRANVTPGSAHRKVKLTSTAAAGRLIRSRCHGSGHALVCHDLGPQLVSLAWEWTPTVHGDGWRLTLAGLGYMDQGGECRRWSTEPAIEVVARGGTVVGSWRDGRPNPRPIPGRSRPRLRPQRGPIIDVANLAEALIGARPSSLATCCRYLDVPEPAATGDPIHDLRARAAALVGLWPRLSAEADCLAGRLDHSYTISAGRVASGWLASTGLPPIADRHHLSDRFAGAAASAFYGGRHEARMVHVRFPAVLSDLSSTYPRVFSALGLGSVLAASGVVEVDVTGEVRYLLASVDIIDRCFDRATWHAMGVTLVKVRACGDVLPLRVGGAVNVTSLDLRGEGAWWHWADVAASLVATGRTPEVIEAVRLVPGLAPEGLAPVVLPSGATVDLATDDVALALVAERARIAADHALSPMARKRLVGMVKMAANMVSSGNLSRIDRQRVAQTDHGRPVTDTVLGPEGERVTTVATGHRERPGPWCSLLMAGAVTAGARLVVALAMAGIEAEGGTWAHVAGDSLLIVATRAGRPELIACPGGFHRKRKGAKSGHVKALPVATVANVLARADRLLCPDGRPAWKQEAGWDRPMVGYVSGVNRFGLVDMEGRCEHVTEVGLGGVFADPTGTGEHTEGGHWRWAVDAHSAWLRHRVGLDRPPLEWIAAPALRHERASRPESLDRLAARFGGRRLRPFVPCLTAMDMTSWTPVVALAGDMAGAKTAATAGHGPTAELPTILHTVQRWAYDQRGPGLHDPVPVTTRASWAELIGKESDVLAATEVYEDDAATERSCYRPADTWAPVLAAVRELGAPKVAALTGLSLRTCEYVLAGRFPAPATAETIRQALATVVDLPAPEGPRFCTRAGCGVRVTGRRRWCSESCRKASERATERIEDQAILPAHRCRKCRTRWVGQPDCPTCAREGSPVSVAGAVCTGCGATFPVNVPDPCPKCERNKSNRERES